jgi:TolC family type I secretion outer membrane protein
LIHILTIFLIFCFSFSAQAEENNGLFHSLAQAYEKNSTLQAARMEYKVVREELPLAQSGLKPTITGDADITYSNIETEGQNFIGNDGSNTAKSAALNLSQPLFKGGTTLAEIREAKNTITAQSLALSNIEQGIIYDAAVAYMDVLQNNAIVELNSKNLDLVARELEQTQAGFDVGELTRTDVSQAKSRLAQAKADLIAAEADLEKVKATYERVVGDVFRGTPAYPDKVIYLPETLSEAISIAETNNRNVLRAKFVTQAAEDNIDSVRGELLPQISAQSGLGRIYDQNDFVDEQDQFTLGVNATIPLYQAGSTRTRMKQAKILANQRYLEVIDARQLAKEEAIMSWEALKSAQAEINARRSQVEAARVAQEGVHFEADVGERTVLDKLNANQELLNAEVDLVKARRNEIVAQFALARGLGLLVPQKLGFSSVNP